jgi:uncharacterized membrane protein
MPPLHPAFVHFPIALVVFSFIAELLNRLFNKPSLRATGSWTLLGALVFGAITSGKGTEPASNGKQVLDKVTKGGD